MNSLDGFEQFGTGGQFEQVAAGSRGEGVKHARSVLINRKHDELNCRVSRLELTHALDAIHAREVNVHEHHLGGSSREMGYCLFSRRELADAGADAKVVHHARELGAYTVVIIDYCDSNRHRFLSPGRA
jgi:hypothetical protein